MSTPSERPPLATPSSYGAPGAGPGVDPVPNPEAEPALGNDAEDPDHREEQG